MPLLDVQNLHKTYGKGRHEVPAVRGVDVGLHQGETLALVGESGCGKSTTARVIAGLTGATAGRIQLDGQRLTPDHMVGETRRRVQMVFQHPEQSRDPRMRVRDSVAEPLKLLSGLRGQELADRVSSIVRSVGLGPEYLGRRPWELSGGQQQRVAIACALVAEPELVILDEPTASLDQSVRARIVSLLRTLQEQHDLGYLFISHDLSVVRRIADRVAVMYLGRVVEEAPTEELFESPQHPYTQALLSAIPVMDPQQRRERITLPGETPNPSELPPGCSFQDRCPLVHDRCRVDDPLLLELTTTHRVACHAVVPGPAGGTPTEGQGAA